MQVLTQAFDREDIRHVVTEKLAEHFPGCEPARPRRSAHPPTGTASGARVAAHLRRTVGHRSSPSTAFAFTSTRSAARRPAPSSTSARTTPPPLATLTARPSTASPTREASPCTWRRVCSKVTAVDSSRPALEVAEQNEQLNRDSHTCGEIEWIEANAFDLLKDYSTAGQSVRHHRPRPARLRQDQARRGNRHPRLQRTQPARPEDASPGRRPGHLLLLVPRGTKAQFLEMLEAAAADAGRRVQNPGKAGRSHRSSGPGRRSGDLLPEVHNLPSY